VLEEKEEASCSRDHTAKKELHKYRHPSLISSPWLFDGAHHNSSRVVDIVVSTQWTPQTGCPILMESVDPIFIGSTRWSNLHPQIWIEIWMGRRIVLISLPQLAIIGLLKIPSVKKSSNAIQGAIQENNTLQNKMNERTYHKVLSMVVHELLHPLLAVLTPYMRLYKQLHWTRLTSKRRSL